MGAFFHAVGVFFEHLADVRWEALGLALACHVVKLLFRARQSLGRELKPETAPDAKHKLSPAQIYEKLAYKI